MDDIRLPDAWRPRESSTPEFIEGLPPPAVCRGRLSIGFQITGGQLKVTVGVGCHTETRQALSTLVWAGRLDACSRRVLSDALRGATRPEPLRHAANPDPGARLPAFAALAHHLFRHTVRSLPPDPGKRMRRPRAACPGRHRPSHALAAGPGINAPPPTADLLAAVHALDTAARFHPRITLADSAAIERLMGDTRYALHGLLATLGTYLEGALQPHIRREAWRAFIPEMRRELDDLAACRTAGVYVEDLSVAEWGDTSTRLEVEGSLGATV